MAPGRFKKTGGLFGLFSLAAPLIGSAISGLSKLFTGKNNNNQQQQRGPPKPQGQMNQLQGKPQMKQIQGLGTQQIKTPIKQQTSAQATTNAA